MGPDLSQPDPFPTVVVPKYITDFYHLGPVVEPAFKFTFELLLTDVPTLVVDVLISDGATVAETTFPEDDDDEGDVAVTALVLEEGVVVTEVSESGPSPTVPLARVVEAALVVPVFPVVVTVVVVVVVVVVLVPLLPETVLLLVSEAAPPGVVTELELSEDPVDACVTETPLTELVHTPSLLNLYSVPSMVRVLLFCILPSLK